MILQLISNGTRSTSSSIIPRSSLVLLLASLLLSTGLAILLWIVRTLYLDTTLYSFLNWNLFLAWIPLLAALALSRIQRLTWLTAPIAGLVFCVWILFLPNAPYLVTDLMHLVYKPSPIVWYDVMMIFAYAWNGVLLGFVSLWIVQAMARAWFGWLVSWLLVAGSLGAAGFGIYLGRFLRWNSWDVVSNPTILVRDIAHLLLNPLQHPKTLGVTLTFGAFLLLGYITLVALVNAKQNEHQA